SRKARTAAAQNGCDLWRGCSTPEQFLGDPLIGDAPVGLWEAFENPQPVQPTGVDIGRGSGRHRALRVGVCARRQRQERRRIRTAQAMLGGFEQSGALSRQAGVGVKHLHPGRVTAPIAALWFLIGEASQASQMTPIGAGRVATVEVSQLFADLSGGGRFDGCGADLHPSLEVAGAGLEYHTGIVPIAPHGFHDGQAGVIQIDEDQTRIALGGVRLDVNVAALAVARAQEPYSGRMDQLGGGPQALSWKSSFGLMVNQADQVKVVRHRRELAEYGLRSEIESVVEHGPNFGIERTRRTMNSQRTANRGLTGCLSLGVHRNRSPTPCSSPTLLLICGWLVSCPD